MQKPSERIVEIYTQTLNKGRGASINDAILQYLDEQAAKQDLSSEHIKEE